MKGILKIVFVIFVSTQSFAQTEAAAFSFCDKTGDCTMTWDEFINCKKQLVVIDKNVSISSFILTVKKKQKKGYVFLEFPAKGSQFSKASLDAIKKLHEDKKLGDKLQIDTVEVVQSGKPAKKVPGMVIILN